MKNIINYLSKKGYNCKIVSYGYGENKKDCIVVDNDYIGLYPNKEQYDNLHFIQGYIRKYHPNYKVEQIGFFTAIRIYN